MKKVLKEIGKAVLALLTMFASMVLFLFIEEWTGFLWSDYTSTKVTMQTIIMTAQFAVLWYTRCGVVATISKNIAFLIVFLTLSSTGVSPWMAILMLAETMLIYLRKDNTKNTEENKDDNQD